MKLQLSNSVFHKVISRMNRILRMSIDWLTWIINLTLSTYVVYVYIMPLRMPDTLTVLPYYRLLTAVIVYGNKGISEWPGKNNFAGSRRQARMMGPNEPHIQHLSIVWYDA